MPEWEAKERQLKREIDFIPGTTTLYLPEIRRLNEEVDSKPPSQSRLIIHSELAMVGILLVERPSIQPSVDK